MSKRSTRSLAAAASAVVATGLVLAGGAAHAATAPPFEPDSNSYGNITLYNASGQVVTGGNLTDVPISAYSVGSASAPPVVDGGSPAADYTKATLFLAAPQPGENSASWPTDQLSSSTTYPSTTAPVPVAGAKDSGGNSLPVVTGGNTSLSAALATFAPLASTSPDFDIYQLRVYQTGPGLSAGTVFEDMDISVNTTAGTWSEIYPGITATSTTLTATPASGQQATTAGGNVTFALNASTNAATPGTYEFFNGATNIGSVAATVGASSDTASLPGVVQAAPTTVSYTVEFLPTPGGNFQESTSPALNYVANNPATKTTTAATAPTTATAFAPATYSATLTAADGTDPAGVMSFVATNTTTNATTALGNGTEAPAGSGDYSVTSSALGQGTYTLTATFTPTSNKYATSSNTTASFTVGAAQFAPDKQYIQAEVGAGTLTITTPYNSATSPFDLGTLALSPNGTELTTSTTFPAAADGYITITSSQAGDPGWTASVTASSLVSGANSINGENLGLTNLVAHQLAGNALTPGDITFTDNPADAGVGPNDTSGGGLAGGPHQFATTGTNGGDGSININGILTLNAPTSTATGTYAGTITFTIV